MNVFLSLLACALTGGFLLGAPKAAQAAPDNPKILIVYFSKTNNTKNLAEQIHSMIGGDLIELKTAQPYPDDHEANVKIAVEENRSEARPELATVFPDNMDDYDLIFVGYPVWEYTMPMAFFTFFDRYKFEGKTIVPFSTHRGSGLGGGPRDIARLCPQAKVLEGLAVRKLEVSPQTVSDWLKKLGLVQG